MGQAGILLIPKPPGLVALNPRYPSGRGLGFQVFCLIPPRLGAKYEF